MTDVERLEASHSQYEAGRAHMAAGKLDEAVAAFRLSMEVEPHFKTLELLGECHMRLGELTRAIVPLAAATALNRQSRGPALLAEVFERLGQPTKAAEMARTALERSADNQRAKAVLDRLGRSDSAG